MSSGATHQPDDPISRLFARPATPPPIGAPVADDPRRKRALEPFYRYLLKEVVEALYFRDSNHLRVWLHRHQHELGPRLYAYDAHRRRHRVLTMSDVETLTRIYTLRVEHMRGGKHTG